MDSDKQPRVGLSYTVQYLFRTYPATALWHRTELGRQARGGELELMMVAFVPGTSKNVLPTAAAPLYHLRMRALLYLGHIKIHKLNKKEEAFRNLGSMFKVPSPPQVVAFPCVWHSSGHPSGQINLWST